MVRISDWANLHNQRGELAFVDVDTNADLRLFIDPYALDIQNDAWSIECANLIRSFFNELLSSLRNGNEQRAHHLASHLRETNETCLGFSAGTPRGRGLGTNQASDLIYALKKSHAFQTGLLSDLSETALFIHGIGSDKISDLTTNIIRGPLLEYTQEQAKLWGMPLHSEIPMQPIWDLKTLDWTQNPRTTLLIDGKPILLVPKHCVRLKLGLNAQEFYNKHMVVALQQEYLRAGQSLVTVLSNGNRRVYKKDVKAAHPFAKDTLANFAKEHPDVLDQYKRLSGAAGALDDDEIYRDFNEFDYAKKLQRELKQIPSGSAHADIYHRYCIGVLTFIFYPDLLNPRKEREINEGRKRIDIAFDNPGGRGFFQSALQSPQMRCIELPIECKNYSSDASNPEIDQICGRFSHTRGFLGFLCSRSFLNRERFVSRCKDAAADRAQFVIPLVDEDINGWLELIILGRREEISNDLRRRYSEIVS